MGEVLFRDHDRAGLASGSLKRVDVERPDRRHVQHAGIDAVGGYVAVEGWAEVLSVTALDLALEFENAGVAAIIHTDVERDGVMAGPNVEATQALADSLSTPVIVSGGVSSLDDLAAVKRAEASGIAGVIVGRALYDGGLDRAAALALLAG